MASLFERFMGRKEPSSAEIAKERLKFVLVTDRSNLSPEKLGEMQAEIIGVIKRYLSIEDTDVEIKYEQRDRKNYLVADISLNRDRNYAAFEAPAEAEAMAGDAASEDASSDALDDVPADMLEDAPGLVAELDESGAGDDDADESAPDADSDAEPDDESGGDPDSEDDDEPD